MFNSYAINPMQMNQMVPGANPYGEVDPERARQMAIQLANAGITGGQIAAGFLTGPVGASLAYGGGEIAKQIIAGQNPMQSLQQGTQAGILDFGTNAALSKIPFAPLLAGGIKKVTGKADDVFRLLHGSEKVFDDFDLSKAGQNMPSYKTNTPVISMTTDEKLAKHYGPNLTERFINKKNLKEYKNLPLGGQNLDKFINEAKEQGYAGIFSNQAIAGASNLEEGVPVMFIFDKTKLKKKGIINK